MNVSISQIVADLNTTVTGVQSAITMYTLVMAAFMLVGAKLGDILGRDRAFGLGLAWWRGQLLFADDQRCLFGPRHFSDCRCKESCRKPQPNFLYDLVERRTCGNHGGSGT